MIGGPPYSPGAVPVDHLACFLFGRMILVGIVFVAGLDDDNDESFDIGVVPEFTVM